jgi:hypothetical protein
MGLARTNDVDQMPVVERFRHAKDHPAANPVVDAAHQRFS